MTGFHPKLEKSEIVNKAPKHLRGSAAMKACVQLLFALLAVLSCVQSHALSLGRLSGSPLLGQPFSGLISATLAPGERLDSDCVKADLYSGDEKINPNNILVDVQGAGESRQIRVRTSQRLNEPLLTVYLEAGCDARISRRYTLFVDPIAAAAPPVEGEQAAPAASTVAPRYVPEPSIAPPFATDTSPRSLPSRVSRPARASKPAVVTPRTAVATAKPSPRKPALKANTETAEPKASSRLKLDLAAPLSAGSFQLTRELSAAVDDAESARRKELRVLRDALMAEIEGKVQPGEFAKRVKELEGANEKLLTEATNARTQLAAERAKREQMENSSYPAWLLYTIGAGLAAALAAAFVFWRRSSALDDEDFSLANQVFNQKQGTQQQAKPSYQQQANLADDDAADDNTTVEHIDLDQPLQQDPEIKWYERFLSVTRRQSAPSELPVTMPMTEEQMLRAARTEVENIGPDSQFSHSRISPHTGSSREETKAQDSQRRVVVAPLTPHEQLAVNEMADISQEAEFFMEIGEDGRAISLLEESISSNNTLTPVPHLYLFDLYRKKGKSEEYDALRLSFEQRFNAYVPEWKEDPSTYGRELSDYPRALEQVCRSWRSDNIIPTLESLLVDDTRGSRLGFDLPAYREVIFLYGIAKQLETESDGSSMDLGIAAGPQSVAHVDDAVDLELPLGEVDMGSHMGKTTVMLEPPTKQAGSEASKHQAAPDTIGPIDFDLDFNDSKASKKT